jgi:7-keto-8-aminopelargonate synthetase-like enzyme
MMSSGYSANEGLLSCVIGPDDWVASDELNHASIIDGLRLSRAERFIFRHHDLDHLEDGLRRAARRPGRELFIVTESIFSMDGDLAPLTDIVALAQRYHAHLIVDEAHATGCFGAAGSGLVDEWGLRATVLATVHTGGKALGVCGAYVVGDCLLRDWLVNRCRHLIYTTALPPMLGPLWLDTIRRVRSDSNGRKRLHENARVFRQSLRDQGIPSLGSAYIVPIVYGSDERAVRAATVLQQQGFDVRAIRPPSVPQGKARLRVSIHADHRLPDLLRLAAAFAKIE